MVYGPISVSGWVSFVRRNLVILLIRWRFIARKKEEKRRKWIHREGKVPSSLCKIEEDLREIIFQFLPYFWRNLYSIFYGPESPSKCLSL